jgi:outer membrane protein TolC
MVLKHLLLAIISGSFISGTLSCAEYEPKPLSSATTEQMLREPDAQTIRVQASQLRHPVLQPMDLDLSKGLTPDQAGVLAVILNPDLRAERDRRAVAQAQLLQAGLLPNPTLNGNLDFPYDSSAPDNHTAYGLGFDWEVTSLITRKAKIEASRADAQSIDLDIAWQEWQSAEAAKTAAYDVAAMQAQLKLAQELDRQMAENLSILRKAVDRHQKTLLDLSAAETAANDAHEAVLAQEKDLEHQRLALNRALGLAPDRKIAIRADELPNRLNPPALDALAADLEQRRLDLIALRKGYQSQDATLRAAILGQFPKISFGLNGARDTTGIKTIGIGLTMDLPIFDRNQGNIAIEKATRQKLFDEYVSRVFGARADIASALADIRSLNNQIAAAEGSIDALVRLAQSYENSFQRGNVDVISYYSARTSVVQKRIDILKLKQQLIDAWISLEIASGQYLPARSTTTATAPSTGPSTP